MVFYTYGSHSLTTNIAQSQELRGSEIVQDNLFSNAHIEEDNQSVQSVQLIFMDTCLDDINDPVEIEEGPGNSMETRVIINNQGSSPLDISVSSLEDAERDADRTTAL